MTAPARSGMPDTESRLGVVPVEKLLAERDRLVKEVAPLRARHGSFGSYDDLRKVELAKVAAIIRAKAVADSVKVTEAYVADAAHAHDSYVQFVEEATKQKAAWAVLENKIANINDAIQRANAVIRFLAAEAHL